MGAAVGDYDHDGDMDWFVTSIHDPEGSSGYGPTGNRLYRNAGGGRFEDATDAAGVREGGWGWGACLADFDNDGHEDLFHTNGWFGLRVEDADGEEREITTFLADPSRLFMANGDGTFTERAAALGVHHTGQGRGVVCADYDGDGRVDILIANHGAAPTVYRNVFETSNRWLAIDLAGRHANLQGIGARVTVTTASGTQVQEVRLGGAYLSQAPPTLHFGLGRDRIAQSIEVRWPGPGGQVSRLDDVTVDRRLTIRQPAPEGALLRVVRGAGAGLHRRGATVAIEAEAGRGHYRFSHWTGEGGGSFRDARAPRTAFTMPAGPATAIAHYLPGPPLSDASVSAARRWIEVLLQAIRDDRARPTVHARNLFHLAAAMYDAWAAWSDTASPYHFGERGTACGPVVPSDGDVERAREEAISHAAWRLLRHRFRHSPGAAETAHNADMLMAALGHDAGHTTGPAAALGACIGDLYVARGGLADRANEANDYASLFYVPVNPDMPPSVPGNAELEDPDRWQPLDLLHFVDQSGNVEDDIPAFVTPEWGRVVPFALSADDLTVHERDGADWHVYHDPGPPPTLSGPGAAHYKWGFTLVVSSPASPSRRRRSNATPRHWGVRSPQRNTTSSNPSPAMLAPSTSVSGTGVPARTTEVEDRCGKQPDGSAKTREAKLAVVWSADTTDNNARPVRDPDSATYNAAIETIATRDTDTAPAPFARRIRREAKRRGFDTAPRQVILGDGAPWIWNFADEHFPDATQIVDIFHAKGHLFEVAKAIYGPGSDVGERWAKQQREALDEGRVDDVVAALRGHAGTCEEARKDVEYFSKQPRAHELPEVPGHGPVRRDRCRRRGCKHIIATRLKRGGMRWSVAGANAIIALRCAVESNRFDDFWERRASPQS